MASVLVLNAGSSSFKFALFGVPGSVGRAPVAPLPEVLRGAIEASDGRPLLQAADAEGRPLPPVAVDPPAVPLEALLRWLAPHLGGERPLVVGHRVAFGGLAFAEPVRITPETLDRLDALVPFAPLHQPANIAPMRWLAEREPGLPQVACFDNGFHRTMPDLAQRYGVPRLLHDAGVRRHGFHGLSYESVVGRLAEVDPEAARGRTIVAHLGSGASLCAMRGGASVATTMGFSALSGVMMATRPGEIDPGIVLWLQRERGLSIAEVERLLYHECGLKGVGGQADMRALLASDAPEARIAVDLFVYRVVREIGSLAAALGGLDALVFTAGVGARSAPVRAAIAEGCRWLGAALDRQANERSAAGAGRATRIGSPASAVRLWVIPTDEEQVIARHAMRVLAMGNGPGAVSRAGE